MNLKYPALFGTLLSLSAHTVIAMTIYTMRSTTTTGNNKIIDFPLVELTYQEPQEKLMPVHTHNQNNVKSRIATKKSSTTKSTSLKNDIPRDLKPSIYNEMPIYPQCAKNKNIESSFSVFLILDKKGTVTRIIFPTSNQPASLFKEEVIKKLSKWKFTSNQNLANIQINVPLQFKLAI